MEKKRLLLVFNPTAGLEAMRMNLFEVITLLSKNDFLVTVYPTKAPRDAYEVISRLGNQYEYVVCSGGDGTLNESVDAMMRLKNRPIFGYIPTGTTNDFATSLGLPTDVLLATQVIENGIETKIDLGKFQEEYFSYIAAFGLFTDVSYGTSQGLKNLFGHTAYLLEGMRRLGNIQSWRCTINADGEVFEDDFIFGMVTNSASVGGFQLPVSQGLTDNHRHFKLILLRTVENIFDLQAVIATLLGREAENKNFIIRPVDQVTITTEKALDWTLDGEFGGSFTETNISIIENALSIMTPSR